MFKKGVTLQGEYMYRIIDGVKKSSDWYKKILNEKDEEIKRLSDEISRLRCEIEWYKRSEKNKRGAGRKPKFNDHEIELIKMYRIQGHTVKTLSEMFECSVGLISKVLKEDKE